uniref:SID1 transmembrane family member 2 n=1 Tax=Leptobrachium leishanense TaxID=445787 RepID=A0A8C5WMH9_9ANUR
MLSDPKGTPLMFVVRQKKAVLSFQVPLTLRGLSGSPGAVYQRNYQYKDVARTLCQPPKRAENETQYIYVDVSTLSEKNATYRLSVTHLQNFVLLTEERFSFNATPSQPQYFKYMFKEGLDSVIVQVSSPMAFPCSVISIQDIQCPVYDLDNNVAFIGMYQTMTKKAAITVQRKDYPSGGFYVVVVVKTEDEACGGGLPYYPINPDVYMDHGTREKAIEVLVKPAISRYTYLGGILFVFGVFLAFYFLRKPMGHPPRCAGSSVRPVVLLIIVSYVGDLCLICRKRKEAGLLTNGGSINDETGNFLALESLWGKTNPRGLFKEIRLVAFHCEIQCTVTFPCHSAIQRAGSSPNPGELPAHTVPVRCLFEGSEIPIEKQSFVYSENTKQQ